MKGHRFPESWPQSVSSRLKVAACLKYGHRVHKFGCLRCDAVFLAADDPRVSTFLGPIPVNAVRVPPERSHGRALVQVFGPIMIKMLHGGANAA